MVVDGRCLRHEARNVPADLMDAGLVAGVNLVGGRALLSKMVNILLQPGVAVHRLAMPDKQLFVCVCFVFRLDIAKKQTHEKRAMRQLKN